MRNFVCAILALSLPACTKAQLTFGEPTEQRPSDRRLQGSVADGWRTDHSELAKTPVVDLGVLFRMKEPFSVVARLSVQAEQNSYFITNLTTGAFAMGVRAQSPGRILSMFGALEIDLSWYMGQTVLYSYDSGRILSRLSSEVSKTGLAFSFGIATRVTSRLGLDLGVRKVLNNSKRGYHDVAMPPANGERVWPFPQDLYNQTVVFLQSRFGIF